MNMRLAALLLLPVIAASSAVLPSDRALAHEHRAVGNYEFVVGFLNEPALAYEPNGLYLSVTFFENGAPEVTEENEDILEQGQPVRGLEETLKAEVIVGGGAQKMDLTLEAGEAGVYSAHFIPTLAGDYTYHISGDINGEAIDESFSSGPQTFDTVEDVTELQFPNKLPSNTDLQSSLDGLSKQVAALDTGGGSDTATILAIIGIAAGVVGIGVGGYALASRRRG